MTLVNALIFAHKRTLIFPTWGGWFQELQLALAACPGLARAVTESEERYADAQKTNVFDQKTGACIKEQEWLATGENCLSCRNGAKGPACDIVNFRVWGVEEESRLGTDVQI